MEFNYRYRKLLRDVLKIVKEYDEKEYNNIIEEIDRIKNDKSYIIECFRDLDMIDMLSKNDIFVKHLVCLVVGCSKYSNRHYRNEILKEWELFND